MLPADDSRNRASHGNGAKRKPWSAPTNPTDSPAVPIASIAGWHAFLNSGWHVPIASMSSKLTDPGIVQLASMPLTTLVYLVDPATPDVSNKMTLAEFFALMGLAFDADNQVYTFGDEVNSLSFVGGYQSFGAASDGSNQFLEMDAGLGNNTFKKPIREVTRVITNADPATIAASDLCVIYNRADGAAIDIATPDNSFSGQRLRIINIRGTGFTLNCSGLANAFRNGAAGKVSSLAIAAGEVVLLGGLYDNVSAHNEWAALSRFSEKIPASLRGIGFDGGGAAISPSSIGYAMIESAITLTSIRLTLPNGATGSITVAIQKNGTTISASDPVVLSSGNTVLFSSFTGWSTRSFATGDRLGALVVGTPTAEYCEINFNGTST